MYDSIVIFGATATGKTKIAIELARKLKTEIINADSMYIYKDLNIGTAKPSREEMSGIKHHLIDHISSENDYNVINFRSDAKKTLILFNNNKLLPIIVGGTGFYINSLITNYSYGNDSHSESLRHELLSDLNKYGKEYLYNKLKEIDPEVASTLHVNDTSRIIRAIEIKLITGNSKNMIINNKSPLLTKPLLIGLNTPREELYKKINIRVDQMLKAGLINEVSELYSRGLTPENSQSMRGIGYKEIVDYLRGNCTLEIAIDKIKQHTRNYAKRQITWFKRYNDAIWFDTLNDKDIVNKIIKIYNKDTIDSNN